MSEQAKIVPIPPHWPHRADPPIRYWSNYELYQRRGGLIRQEEDINGLLLGRSQYGDLSRFYFFCVAFDQLMKEGIRGDIAELGAYRGETASVLAKMARRMNTTCWVMDTFEGFSAADLGGIDGSRSMEFSDTSLEHVRALVGEENTRYIKGYFPESTSQMPADLSFALVHIDCDLYQPILAGLSYFYPRLLPGGYLIVHDYASLAWDGAERAVDEFFADKPESVIPLTDGCGSMVIRKMRPPGRQANWLTVKRAALFSQQYVSATGNALLDILSEGWSQGEDWGVWGIGAKHTLDIVMMEPPASDIVVEIEAAAAVMPARPRQEIDVHVGGRLLQTMTFSTTRNRAKHSIRIPVGEARVGESGCSTLRLEFRPRHVVPVNELAPSSPDTRALGLGLFGIRRAA